MNRHRPYLSYTVLRYTYTYYTRTKAKEKKPSEYDLKSTIKIILTHCPF